LLVEKFICLSPSSFSTMSRLKNNHRKGISEAVTTILLVVIGIAMALMIWQFFTPKPVEELRIGPIDVSGGQVVFTATNVGSVDAEITGVACYPPGSAPPSSPSAVTPWEPEPEPEGTRSHRESLDLSLGLAQVRMLESP
jgi:hypothetical protein